MSQKQLLIIGFVWPEPKSSAAGSRMLQIIDLFLKADYKITFATACAKTDNAFNLEPINIETVQIQLNNSSFDSFIANLNPNVVLFDRFMIEEQFGWRVSEQCPNALKILDTEDLHSLRKGRQQAFKNKEEFNDTYLYNNFAKREIASILRCDITLMISEFEMELLQTKFNVQESQLHYLPFLIEMDTESLENTPKFKERNHIVTIGNFMHEPNWQSVLLLKQQIWPKLSQLLPQAELHIYGSYVSQKATQLHNPKERFFVKGFAENVDAVMQNAKICTAYLPFGAGLKGKLLDAMQNGTPCAMNSIALEGMFGDLKPNGIIEDKIDDFITKTVSLYNNKLEWVKAQENGFKILDKRFSKSLFEADFNYKIEDVLKNISTHRNQHYISQVLQHQTLQSSKYMSKWIEEKNK
ncbi:glycosyltransferase [Aurantibacter sp.]|uniref:glycosyltransferase n=1 Tax=Aurantibacter sp. TaxID=2807103 RepID=UPI0035C7F222